LSWTLNRYGGRHAIVTSTGAVPAHSLTGAYGERYIHASEALGAYLAARYGDAVVIRLTHHDTWSARRRRAWWRAALTGRQGIILVVRYVAGRPDSHVALWDCDTFYQSRDWLVDAAHLVTVQFWEAAGSRRFSHPIGLMTYWVVGYVSLGTYILGGSLTGGPFVLKVNRNRISADEILKMYNQR